MCILAVGAETQQFAKETFHLNKRYKGLFHYEIPVTKRYILQVTFEILTLVLIYFLYIHCKI